MNRHRIISILVGMALVLVVLLGQSVLYTVITNLNLNKRWAEKL